jgi:hypothetical protein
MAICRHIARIVWATGLGHEPTSGVWTDNENAHLQALRKTGATGLEPATSGVTGMFQQATIGHD